MPENLLEEQWKIVRARISSMSPHLRLSIGGMGTMTKEELIQHIDGKDDVGRILLKVHMNYLRSFKEEAKILG